MSKKSNKINADIRIRNQIPKKAHSYEIVEITTENREITDQIEQIFDNRANEIKFEKPEEQIKNEEVRIRIGSEKRDRERREKKDRKRERI